MAVILQESADETVRTGRLLASGYIGYRPDAVGRRCCRGTGNRGRAFVIQDCGSCHGLKLKGGLGPPLRPEDIETLPEAAIAAIIREGVPGTAMPPWKALLSDQEIAWISRQLKSGALIAPEVDSSRSR
jgi:cytochrome c55X